MSGLDHEAGDQGWHGHGKGFQEWKERKGNLRVAGESDTAVMTKGLKSVDEGLRDSLDQGCERRKRVVIPDQGLVLTLQVQLCVMQLQSTSLQV